MTDRSRPFLRRLCALPAAAALLLLVPAGASAQGASPAAAPRTADYIVAVVNQELVTAFELEQRIARVRQDATRAGQRLPPDDELRRQVLALLIEERCILSVARETVRVDEVELDRAVASVATQNQIALPQLRERLAREGIDYGRFRANIRDQMMMERLREREVQSRIKINEIDIDAYVQKQRGTSAPQPEYNLAQILVIVPGDADDATKAERRARADQALQRVRGGEAFATVARELSEDANREKGGEIGLRGANRLPDLFVDAVRYLNTGDITPELVKSPAGWHIIKVVERRDATGFRVTQTHARHILLRPSAQLGPEAAVRRLTEFKRQIDSGSRRFEDLAREFSEDGSASQGGDLGWTSPGSFVPEFEEAMNKLPLGGVSGPVASRFGLHLIQALERRETTVDVKQVREQARNALREQRFEAAYTDWVRELRDRAWVEFREPPQ